MPKHRSKPPSLGIGGDLERLVQHREFAYARNPSALRYRKLQKARELLAKRRGEEFRKPPDPLLGAKVRPVLGPEPRPKRTPVRVWFQIGQRVFSPEYGYGRVWYQNGTSVKTNWDLFDLPHRVLNVNEHEINAWPFWLPPREPDWRSC